MYAKMKGVKKVNRTQQSHSRRKRENLVPRACDACRRAKTKCDALQPICTRCSKKGIPCSYVIPHKKRGVVAGKTKQLEELVHLLTDELISKGGEQELIMHLLSDHAPTALPLLPLVEKANTSQHKLNPLPTPLNIFPKMEHPADIELYIHAYEKYTWTLFGAMITQEILLQWESDQASSPLSLLQKMFAYAALANGALIAGHKEQANEFVFLAREFMGQQWDLSHPLVAATHQLLSLYHTLVGTIDKGQYHNRMAIQISKLLLNQLIHLDESMQIMLINTYISANLLSSVYQTSERVKRINKSITALDEYEDIFVNTGHSSLLGAKKAFAMLYKILAQVMTKQFDDVQCNKQLDEVETMIENELTEPKDSVMFGKFMLQTYAKAIRSCIFYRKGFHEKASQYAADVLRRTVELVNHNEGFYTPYAMQPLICAAQVQKLEGNHEQLNQIMFLLHDASNRSFPIIDKILTRIPHFNFTACEDESYDASLPLYVPILPSDMPSESSSDCGEPASTPDGPSPSPSFTLSDEELDQEFVMSFFEEESL